MNFDRIINDNDCQWENIDLKNYVIADHAAPGVRNQLFNDMNAKSNKKIVRAIMNVCECDGNNGQKFEGLFFEMIDNDIGRDMLVNISETVNPKSPNI